MNLDYHLSQRIKKFLTWEDVKSVDWKDFDCYFLTRAKPYFDQQLFVVSCCRCIPNCQMYLLF